MRLHAVPAPTHVPGRAICATSGKICHEDRETAQAVASRGGKGGVKLSVYHCFHCDGWHLTKRLWRGAN